MLAHLFTLTLLVFCAPAFGGPVQAGRLMSITYGSPSWNTNSAKIDAAYLIMRDKATGRIVQINLEETEPDSSQFSGSFSVNIGESDKILPEIFIPPSNLRGTDKDNRKLYEQIQSNKLPRKPVIWKKNERGQATLDVYDTREQAEAALRAYQAQVNLAKAAALAKVAKPLASVNANVVAAQVEKNVLLNQLAREAAKRESDRVRLEQIERQKAEERLREMRALNEQQKADRQARAIVKAGEAMAFFEQAKFAAAEIKFKEAVEIDPENTSYYFKYGVTLYRNEKYNDALVILNLVKTDGRNDLERGYFTGLTHYRLKELDAAMGQFDIVANAGDAVMSPSSEFYRGVILFAQEEYEAAKRAFEKVIDTSNDPRLDEQAETYIDRIATAIIFQKLRENKFTLLSTVGAMYDSNVLLAPDNAPDQGRSTDIADFRLLTIADLEYRPVYTDNHEFFLRGSAGLTNSLKNESAPADPYLYTFAAPYSYKGAMGKKGFKATLKPGYEMLYMATGGSSTKTAALMSYFLYADTTIVMNPTWFANYNFEYRGDDSKVVSSVGPDDADAGRYSLRTNQTFFLDKSRKRALIGSLGYVLNAAKGDNRKYNRVEAGAAFTRPWKWETIWNVGVNIYKLDFPDETFKRNDFNVTVSSGISKPVKEWLLWGFSGSYTKNDSNVAVQEYSKYTILTTATFLTNF